MAKRKKTKRPRPVLTEPLERTLREHTTESVWNDLPNYVCNYCESAWLDPRAAVEHFVAAHAPKPASARSINTGLVDETGSPIVRDEIAPPEEDGS